MNQPLSLLEKEKKKQQKLEKREYERKLIEEVKKVECLYAKDSREYNNRRSREIAWNDIALILGKTVDECQKKWNSLRDAFRTYLRDQCNAPSNSAMVPKINWPHYERLKFLIPYIKIHESSNSNPYEDFAASTSSCSSVDISFQTDMSGENAQLKSILFVRKVKKYPILYNYNLPGFTNKIEIERAWHEIGSELNMTVDECKRKWKSLRTCLRRHKKAMHAPGAQSIRNAYYLSDEMQFVMPYIGFLNSIENSENQVKTDDELLEVDCVKQEAPLEVESSHGLSPSPSMFEEEHQERLNAESIPQVGKKRRISQSDIVPDSNAKKEALEMFLLSMLPDLQQMTDEEVRLYKRKTIEIVDDIFLARSRVSYLNGAPEQEAFTVSVVKTELDDS